MVINEGNVVEMKTRRTYFLDYPCDLKPGEKVTFVLSLHGAGSYGNWQRNYFPIMDYKDKYRLVIATPNSPTRVWSDADDQYLHNIVDFVTEQIGKENIKAFWLAGHSQGGLTSNRLIRTDYFKDKVDGWLSLSGGRLGGNPGRGATFAPTGPAPGAVPAGAAPAAPGTARPGAPAANPAGAPPGMTAAMAALRELPTNDFSFIYETGRREIDDKGLPETSDWAKKYNCGARGNPQEVVDTKAGYVYDSSRLNQLRPGWGLLPGPGKAQVYTFPDCKDGPSGGRCCSVGQRAHRRARTESDRRVGEADAVCERWQDAADALISTLSRSHRSQANGRTIYATANYSGADIVCWLYAL
jgi:hypothetical protein